MKRVLNRRTFLFIVFADSKLTSYFHSTTNVTIKYRTRIKASIASDIFVFDYSNQVTTFNL